MVFPDGTRRMKEATARTYSSVRKKLQFMRGGSRSSGQWRNGHRQQGVTALANGGEYAGSWDVDGELSSKKQKMKKHGTFTYRHADGSTKQQN
jgi:hypothetical protein